MRRIPHQQAQRPETTHYFLPASVDPAALDGRSGHGGLDGLAQAQVGVGDDQLHPGQPMGLERPQERGPERAVLAIADVQAQDLAAPSAVTPVAITTARETTRPSTLALR
jgi:hypothetical protein